MKLKQLLTEAQFHGARRLAERRHSIFWAVSLTIFLALAACVISATVRRFQDNPTYLLRITSQHYTLWFPAVIVCPEIRFPQYKVEAFIKDIKLPEGVNASYLGKILPQLAAFFAPDINYSLKELELLERVLDYNSLSPANVTERLMTSCEESFIRCRWDGRIVDCMELFRMELTGAGFCCVFNAKSLYREIKEYGLVKKMPKIIYSVKRAGPLSGLMFVLNQSQVHDDVDLSYKWIALIPGQFYVDYPVNGTPISPDSENWFGYTFELNRISTQARSLGASLRHCKMSDEPLQYFPYYQKEFCLWECEIHRTLRKCACLSHNHPPLPGYPRCKAHNLVCIEHAKVTYNTDQCDCPRTCESSIDIVTLQTSQLVVSDTLDCPDEVYENLNFEKVSVVRVFYDDHKSNTFLRHSYFGTVTLFAQIGGDFSVFFGCSVLSICEFLQFFYFIIKNTYLEKMDSREENISTQKSKKIKVNFKKRTKKANVTL